MDKVKDILKVLQKHHFWLLSVVAMLAGFVGWYMARGSLKLEYDKNKSSITGKFSALSSILQTENHPNDDWTAKIKEKTEEQKRLVRTAWDSIYKEQQQHLEWPPEMGQDFLDFIQRSPPNAEIPRDFCARYQDRIIRSEFPRLLAIVEAKPMDLASGATRPAGGGDGDTPPQTYKVVWEESSQAAAQKLFSFSNVPSSAQVRQAQEDIWVYKALLNVIKAMNQDSHSGKVHRIDEIAIGQQAVKPFQAGMGPNRVEKLRAAGEAAAADAGPPPAPPIEVEGVEKPIDDGRYVDAAGQPLPGGQAVTTQFKRMPIFMRLAIDQREITRFLAQCVNSPLPVEVRHVRIGAGKESAGAAKPGTPGGAAGPMAARSEGETFEVPIEVAGIVYIYNPPDTEKLGGAAPAPASAAGQ